VRSKSRPAPYGFPILAILSAGNGDDIVQAFEGLGPLRHLPQRGEVDPAECEARSRIGWGDFQGPRAKESAAENLNPQLKEERP